jgi:hypothetical protein
VEEH